MSKECQRKFGFKKINRFNSEILCKVCKMPAGKHRGNAICPDPKQVAKDKKAFQKLQHKSLRDSYAVLGLDMPFDIE